jgi:hypothetical protein
MTPLHQTPPIVRLVATLECEIAAWELQLEGASRRELSEAERRQPHEDPYAELRAKVEAARPLLARLREVVTPVDLVAVYRAASALTFPEPEFPVTRGQDAAGSAFGARLRAAIDEMKIELTPSPLPSPRPKPASGH